MTHATMQASAAQAFARPRAWALACALALVQLCGCGHIPMEHPLTMPLHYLDNSLPFQPNRIWRLRARWEPYLLDQDKAMVIKHFQLIVHAEADRKRLENEIKWHGGDARYLRWLESELFPLGNWERRDEARIARLSDVTVVTLVTKSQKEVPISGSFNVSPVQFPDKLLRAVNEGCHPLNWDVIPKDESVGFEVVLESRNDQPFAEHWKKQEYDSPSFWWKAWSVGQEKSVSYRTMIAFKTNVARCPLPPKIHEQFKLVRRGQPMGVDW